MKNLIILEDNPDRTKSYIKTLKDKQLVQVKKLMFFCQSDQMYDQMLKYIESDFEKLGVEIERLTLWDFDEKLDYYFDESNNLFLFDLHLIGDHSTRFHNRVNVVYAQRKDNDIDNPRIWFYTGVETEKEQLDEMFKIKVINVVGKNENGLELDFDGNTTFKDACERNN